MQDEIMEDEFTNEVQDQHDIPKCWRYVEVAGSFYANEGGGGFVLRACDGKALLAQAFPAPGDSILHVDAYAINKAMEEMISLNEEDVVFCLESEVLYNSIQSGCLVPDVSLARLRDSIYWYKQKHSFRVMLSKREDLEAAKWLSFCGRICRQYCQWDSSRPWPPVLEHIVKAKSSVEVQ
ncbi:uncharacterized protein A4U43_C03F1360 [Asparagus officinalis]|uniref:RNase H type-1 domain-containing protein n=1 Tax=Asparagus officinalis TaxID=4686 RepID=A0A5P1FBP7_ASPOF|nr:uncharacterized protein A4U43_C03F1360 [Asparagus officinalis]